LTKTLERKNKNEQTVILVLNFTSRYHKGF